MDGIAGLIARPGRVVGMLDLPPNLEVNRREQCIARRPQLDPRDDQPISYCQGLGVDVGAPYYGDLPHTSAQSIAARSIERSSKARRYQRSCDCEHAITSYDNIGPTGQRFPGEGVIGFPANDHWPTPSERPEVLHVGLEPPRQRTTLPNHAVLSDGGD
jgi:hypothetical protein